MEINRSAIKYNAKMAIRSTQPHSPYLVTLAYLAFILITGALTGAVMLPYTIQNYAGNITIGMTIARLLLYFALMLITSVIGAGYTIYSLHVSRNQPASVGMLFDGFALILKLIGLYIVQGFFFFLWSMLFFIPGIIASLRYSQAFYIMLDHPEYSVMQCIRESKRLMTGRKGEYFVLSLSFIGWIYLSCIPGVIIWVAPYMQVTTCNYYNALVELDWKTRYPGPQTPPPVGPGYGF